MAFLDTYSGEVISLNWVQPTIEAKSIWVPGKNCAFDVEVKGTEAYYFDNETFKIDEGEAGRKLDLAATGAKRHSFELNRSYGIRRHSATCRSCNCQ